MKQYSIESLVKPASKMQEGVHGFSSSQRLSGLPVNSFKSTDEMDNYAIDLMARNIVPLIVQFSEVVSWTDNITGEICYEMTFTFPK